MGHRAAASVYLEKPADVDGFVDDCHSRNITSIRTSLYPPYAIGQCEG
jgi:hypothetical protein